MSLSQRSNASRRDRRNQSALPYSRPTKQSNQASFSLLGGLFNWFKSLAGGEEEEREEVANGLPNSAPAALRERTADAADGETAPATLAPVQLPPPPPPPSRLPQATPSMSSLPGTYVPTPSVSASNSLKQLQPIASTSTIAPPPRAPRVSTSPLLDQVGTPADNIATVSAFLAGKNGQPLNRVEVAGLVSLLQNSMPDDEPREPFRFSTSPSTPIEPSSSDLNGAAERPRKTLAKNPNGTYRWQGAGSARPRNRYQSAAFGPSRSVPVKLKVAPEQSMSDTKRRRVGESAAASTSQRVAAPTPTGRPSTFVNATASGSGVNGTGKAQPSSSSSFLTVPGVPQPSSSSAPKTNGAHAPPTTPARIRTTVKTAPAVPSPLRQTWGQTDSPSPPANKPTRAANVMTELIKGATPPKKPAFANPYQAALPAPLVNRSKKPTGRKRAAVAKAEAAAKAAAEAEAKAKAEAEKINDIEMTPEEIIAATVPPGLKRARPPPDFEKPKKAAPISPTSRRARFDTTMVVSVFGNGSPSNDPPRVVVEEVTDEDEPSPKKKARRHNVPLPDVSPVRAPTAVSVEEVEDTEMTQDSTPVVQPSQVIEPENNRRSPSPSATAPTATIPNPFNKLKYSAPPKAPSKLRFSIRPEEQAKEQEESGSSMSTDRTARSLGLATPPPSLQLVPASSTSTAPTVGRPLAVPKRPHFQTESEVMDWVKVVAPTELPVYSFAVATSSPGAGPSTLKAREAAKAVSMTTLPKFDFTSSAVAKAPAVKGFDWAAAGMKPPSAPSGGAWTCELCGLVTDDAAADKCATCETPRPRATASKPVTQGFNWAAAGIKPPTQPADGSWKCGTCGCTTPAANAKCVACEAPRPAEVKPAPVQGFNWAAAGLKKADLSGRWVCSLCALSNVDSVSECSVCKEPRP